MTLTRLILKFVYIFFLFTLIKSIKWVDTTDPFNKYVMLGLKNHYSFNKQVELRSTYLIKYS